VIHVKETATQEACTKHTTKTLGGIYSASLTTIALDLWSEKIRRWSGPTLYGHGVQCEMVLSALDTLFCLSESDTAALVGVIGGNACSCSPRYPTPTASDWKGSVGIGSRRGTLAERLAMLCPPARGETQTAYPHPEFVELLMGFPTGWTDLEPSAMQ
jgi:hypothetical protein